MSAQLTAANQSSSASKATSTAKDTVNTTAQPAAAPSSHSNGKVNASHANSRKKGKADATSAAHNGKRAASASDTIASISSASSSAAVNGGGKVALPAVTVPNSRGTVTTIGQLHRHTLVETALACTHRLVARLVTDICVSLSTVCVCAAMSAVWPWLYAVFVCCTCCGADPSLHYLYMLARDPLLNNVQHQNKYQLITH